MSNWSLVIVNWTSIDDVAKSEGHEHRAGRIAAMRGVPFTYVAPCGPKSMGGTCEVAVVMHINHFSPYDSMGDGTLEWNEFSNRLRDMAWTFPEEVAILWKAEDDDDWHLAYPCRYGVVPRTAPPKEPA